MIFYHLFIVVLLAFLAFCQAKSFANVDQFDEQLLIKPLPSGHVYAQFDFRTWLRRDLLNIHWENHFQSFPLSFSQFVVDNEVSELHFSLTKGVWKPSKWGYPVRSRSSGAELLAWFQSGVKNPIDQWKKVTADLSGRFCASINFIDKHHSFRPKLSFYDDIYRDTLNYSHAFYATLPPEAVCTENLTPWKKLLPCFSKAGIAELLNALPMLNSHYFSIAIDFRPVCEDSQCLKRALELRQTLDVVFNPPALLEGRQSWSLIKLFGSSIKSQCPLSSSSKIFVDITKNGTDLQKSTLTPVPHSEIQDLENETKFAVYDIKKVFSQEVSPNKFNIANLFSEKHLYTKIPPPPLLATRYLTGSVMSEGSIKIDLHNSLSKPIRVHYLDVIPWYLRIYFNTLSIKLIQQLSKKTDANIVPTSWYYKPAKNREYPHQVELELELPPQSLVRISFDFERAFLKWTEYPPDANHGIYVGPAVITVLDNSRLLKNQTKSFLEVTWKSDGQGVYSVPLRIYTEPLLVNLPTPDFSMPYNVICLVSTVVSLAFGPIHNLTTKKAVIINDLSEEQTKSSLLSKLMFWKK